MKKTNYIVVLCCVFSLLLNVDKAYPASVDQRRPDSIFAEALECYESDKPDMRKAYMFFKLAANKGSAEALFFLGKMYENGDFVDKNSEEAKRYYKEAAKAGFKEAEDVLSEKYGETFELTLEQINDKLHDAVVNREYNNIFKYSKLGADKGDGFCQEIVAFCFDEGNGTDINKKEALKYFKLAAQKNRDRALLFLAKYYHDGEVVKKDEKEALKYLKLAAERNNDTAEYILATEYIKGNKYLKKDTQKAVELMERAAEHGNENAKILVAKIERRANASSWDKQALRKAEQYLSITGFSYKGLVEQLEFDGYTNSQATFAADNCGADWNYQALRKAKQYLSVSAFSYKELIEQLKYDGFTYSQCEYAADNL